MDQDDRGDREVGSPHGPGHRGWHDRWYMPHFDAAGVIQHVTFRLADSLPAHVVQQLDREFGNFPRNLQDPVHRHRIDAWMDAGEGSCILQVPEIAAMVEDALHFFDGSRYRLYAWVVMPNHVHTLFEPINEWPVSKIVASWKKYSSRKIKDYLRDSGQEVRGNAVMEFSGGGEPIGRLAARGVWHREYWDRFIRNDRHFESVVEYIHQNPVKVGLVSNPKDWPWSSAGRGTERPGMCNPL